MSQFVLKKCPQDGSTRVKKETWQKNMNFRIQNKGDSLYSIR